MGVIEAGTKRSTHLCTVTAATTAFCQAELGRVLEGFWGPGVTCGFWRGKNRAGQESRGTGLNGASWNATPHQGAWGLSLPICETGKGDMLEN